MKQLIKKIIPKPLHPLARRIAERSTPARKRYAGENGSVLQCCVAYNDFGGYCIPLSSKRRPSTQTVMSGGVWEPETIKYITTNCAGGDIVHAGAYFGDFFPALSTACTLGTKLWAFEPDPENYRCARITILINGLSNVVLANAALGPERGTAPLIVAEPTGQSLGGRSRMLGSVRRDTGGRRVMVEVVRIDDVVPSDRRVSILQLDVEGFEQHALSGALNTIRRNAPILILEKLPEQGWLHEHLLPLGYRMAAKVHGNTVLDCR
jgi:FkbM family methyltransferase